MSAQNRLKVTIRDGRRRAYRYRRDLAEFGFRYDQNSNAWTLTERIGRHEEHNLRRFCKRKKLKIEVTGEGLVRNKSYRNDFLAEYGREKFLCAYCGKRLSGSTMTVDHIIPIGKFKNKKRAKRLALLGIRNINDTRNLAPACSKCNSKKGMKTGLWVIRGFLGKSYERRLAMNWIKYITIIAMFLIFFTLFQTLLVKYK